jgi:Glycerate kinase family
VNASFALLDETAVVESARAWSRRSAAGCSTRQEMGPGKSDTAAGPDLPVVAVCGVSSLSPEQLRSAGITRAYALADIEPDLTRCREQAGPLLEDPAERVARDWLVP